MGIPAGAVECARVSWRWGGAVAVVAVVAVVAASRLSLLSVPSRRLKSLDWRRVVEHGLRGGSRQGDDGMRGPDPGLVLVQVPPLRFETGSLEPNVTRITTTTTTTTTAHTTS